MHVPRCSACLLLSVWLCGCGPTSPLPDRRTANTELPRIKAGWGLDCGKLVRRVKPVYPLAALQQHVRGPVRLQLLVTKTGEARVVSVLHGQPLLVSAAIGAARQRRYEPCRVDGVPVEVFAVAEFCFPPD